MQTTFELWNTRTGNLVGTFASEVAALEAVASLADQHGIAYVERLALGSEDNRGQSRQIATGADLAARAQAAALRRATA